MIALQQVVACAGLASNEIILGVAPCVEHDRLLSGYLFNLGRGPAAVRDMIVADLRCFLDLGAARQAADRLIVLRRFLSDYPQAGCVPPERKREGIASVPLPSNHSRKREDRIGKGEVAAGLPRRGMRQKVAPIVWSGPCLRR